MRMYSCHDFFARFVAALFCLQEVNALLTGKLTVEVCFWSLALYSMLFMVAVKDESAVEEEFDSMFGVDTTAQALDSLPSAPTHEPTTAHGLILHWFYGLMTMTDVVRITAVAERPAKVTRATVDELLAS